MGNTEDSGPSDHSSLTIETHWHPDSWKIHRFQHEFSKFYQSTNPNAAVVGARWKSKPDSNKWITSLLLLTYLLSCLLTHSQYSTSIPQVFERGCAHLRNNLSFYLRDAMRCCHRLSFCLSVTSCRIVLTAQQDSPPRDSTFITQKISTKLWWNHPQRGHKMQVKIAYFDWSLKVLLRLTCCLFGLFVQQL